MKPVSKRDAEGICVYGHPLADLRRNSEVPESLMEHIEWSAATASRGPFRARRAISIMIACSVIVIGVACLAPSALCLTAPAIIGLYIGIIYFARIRDPRPEREIGDRRYRVVTLEGHDAWTTTGRLMERLEPGDPRLPIFLSTAADLAEESIKLTNHRKELLTRRDQLQPLPVLEQMVRTKRHQASQESDDVLRQSMQSEVVRLESDAALHGGIAKALELIKGTFPHISEAESALLAKAKRKVSEEDLPAFRLEIAGISTELKPLLKGVWRELKEVDQSI